MTRSKVPASLTVFALAASLSVAGCSKGKQQQANNPSQTPSAAQSTANNNPPPPPPDQASAPPSAASQEQQQRPQQQQVPPPPARVSIPAGVRLRVRLDQDLGSKISQAGDTFSATVADDVVVNGQVVIPRGARAEGTVIAARPLGRFKGGAELALRLERVHTRWGSYPVATSTMAQVEKGKGRRTAIFAGGGGAFGALVGGLAGGGKGALIGALAGAGAGTAGDALTGNRQIFLPAETLVTFRLEHSVHVTE